MATSTELDDYLRHAKGRAFLTASEEKALIAEAQSGDQGSLSRLVSCNIRYVARVARRLCRSPLMKIPLLDACQEGALGLMKAVRDFDPTLNIRLTTYATPWIMRYIQRANLEYLSIYLPNHHFYEGKTQVGKVLSEKSKLALGCRNASEYEHDGGEPVSWDQLFGCREDPALEVVAAREEAELIKAQIRAWLGRLESREAAVISARFGLDGNPAQPLKTVGPSLGITWQRVQQVQERALRKLRIHAREANPC